MLLNYYGYVLFFYHTLSAFSGQTIHLPDQTLSFNPNPASFGTATGTAVLPILLGGGLGTVTITPTTAVLEMLFLPTGAVSTPTASNAPSNTDAAQQTAQGTEPLRFINVTICQHSFPGAHVLRLRTPLSFVLPARCASDLVASRRAGTAATKV